MISSWTLGDTYGAIAILVFDIALIVIFFYEGWKKHDTS
jgi:uncharacterized membrane protein YphA (DoxX/SURF4 family)